MEIDSCRLQGLQHAQPVELAEIEISPTGLGLHFPLLDADVYIPSLLKGALGSRLWMAHMLSNTEGQRIKSKVPISYKNKQSAEWPQASLEA